VRVITFWALDATVLFALSLVYLHQGYQRKNPVFAVWLFTGVAMQLVGAWSLAAGRPPWVSQVRVVHDVLMYALTVGVLLIAVTRRDCPVNRTLLWGLGAMFALNLFSRFLGVRVDHSVQVWLRNIAFFGPAVFLLIALSGIRFDMLPLWVSAKLRTVGGQWVEEPVVVAAAGIFGLLRNRREPR